MFDKTNKILIILLAVQFGLLFWLNSGVEAGTKIIQNVNLVNFTADQVTGIIINDKEEKSIVLKKDAGKWVLEQQDNFPADSKRIENILEQLITLKAAYPVGTSKIAAKQFKTSPENFEMKVSFQAGDQSEDLYFGTVPTYKKVYLGSSKDDNSYIVNFQTHELEADIKSWFKKDLLKLEKPKISEVKFRRIELTKTGDKLKIADLHDNEELQEEALNKFLEKIIGLSYNELPQKIEPEAYKNGEPYLTYSIGYDNQIYNFEIRKSEPDKYILFTDYQRYYFELDKAQVEDLAKLDRGNLVLEREKAES